MKKRKIKERLETIDRRLADAEKYVARNENVESSSFLHFADWKGKSGHPLWMKNWMIPSTKRARAKMEKTMDRINTKKKDRKSDRRRRSST